MNPLSGRGNPLADAAAKKKAPEKKMTRQERALAKKAEEDKKMMLKKAKKAAGGKKGGKGRLGKGRGKGKGLGGLGKGKGKLKKKNKAAAAVEANPPKETAAPDSPAPAPAEKKVTKLLGPSDTKIETAPAAGSDNSVATDTGRATAVSTETPEEEVVADSEKHGGKLKSLFQAPTMTEMDHSDADAAAKALIDAAIQKRKTRRASASLNRTLGVMKNVQGDKVPNAGEKKAKAVVFTSKQFEKLNLKAKKFKAGKMKPPPGIKKPPPPPLLKKKAVPPPPPAL
jgi:hypothetical protein